MPLTLEQLDVYGSIENVPYSLDNTFYDGKVCGPWTLEQLNNLSEFQELAQEKAFEKVFITFPSLFEFPPAVLI